MQDPGQVQAVVSFLAPFLPYLVAGATEATKALGKKAGELVSEAAWVKAQTVWSKVVGRLTPKQKAKAGVIAVDPADQVEVASFAHGLIDTLAADPALAAELAALLEKDESVQKVIALNESWVQEVIQKGPGYKLVQADGKSTVIGVHQES
jgi:adenylate kinase family enzyme